MAYEDDSACDDLQYRVLGWLSARNVENGPSAIAVRRLGSASESHGTP
jgi:hypothetical protein